MYLNLQKISNKEYRLDPTPESIAFCDYFVANAVFDGVSAWELPLNPGELYIDDIEVLSISAYDNEGVISTHFDWGPYHGRYDNFFYPLFEVFIGDSGTFPKGTFRVYDDS